jgi:hypothetical protein
MIRVSEMTTVAAAARCLAYIDPVGSGRCEGGVRMSRPASVPVRERLLIAMWSAPRSRSTAFERMMMERGDLTVLHEPFSRVADFGETAVGDLVVRGEAELLSVLGGLGGRTFFKDTTDFRYPRLLADGEFLRDTVHTFILRHPRAAIASHARLNPRVERDEIGFARLYEIYEAVRGKGEQEPIVVDSDDLLANPAEIVEEYCRRVGIPFVARALRWDSGIPDQWARTERWHRAAGASNGFHPAVASPETVELEPRLEEFCRFHLPYYEKMRERRLCPV